jgi:hypothetical protein
MGIKKIPIIVYTHSDMEDIWDVFFGQLRKYMDGFNIYVATDRPNKGIPSDYTVIQYSDDKTYTERWVEILNQIQEEVILFMHEDMILFNEPNLEYLNNYYEYVKNGKSKSIKLILSGEDWRESTFDKTLANGEFSKFSVQPSIVSKTVFRELVEFKKLNIWEFEESIKPDNLHFMVRLGGEPKRGIYHYDSKVFPYIATAINKGKWNMTEYRNELDILFEEYRINPFERGIV